MKLKRGDIFCSRNPMCLGRAINFIQKVRAKDNQSEYSHSGVIVVGGDVIEAISFEALWTNKKRGFYPAYKGMKVLVGRHKDMNLKSFNAGWNGIKKHEGKWYAGHRLLLFSFVPFLLKYLTSIWGVCSELTMKFLFKAGLASAWKGWNPDDVADMIHNYKDYEVVFEGLLE